jgi:hypothetical protein
VTLKFKVLSGESPLIFTNGNLLDETGRVIETLQDHWRGGDLLDPKR